MNFTAKSVVGVIALLMTSSVGAAPIDWTRVDQTIGKPGAEQPDGVHKFSFPRPDLKVTVDGVALKPALALGSWVAFQPTGQGTMLMGDLVLPRSAR